MQKTLRGWLVRNRITAAIQAAKFEDEDDFQYDEVRLHIVRTYISSVPDFFLTDPEERHAYAFFRKFQSDDCSR